MVCSPASGTATVCVSLRAEHLCSSAATLRGGSSRPERPGHTGCPGPTTQGDPSCRLAGTDNDSTGDGAFGWGRIGSVGNLLIGRSHLPDLQLCRAVSTALGHRDAFWSTQRQAEPGKLQGPSGGSHTARSPCHGFAEQSGDGDYTACRATSQRKESGAKVPRPSQPRGQFPCHKKRYP